MYFVLYDRHLNSIGETYLLESWSRVQRAVDFDDLRIVGEQIPYSAEPYLVVVNDNRGKLKFSGLASTPIIDNRLKKTTISLKDYTTLFNTDVVINWGDFKGSSLQEYLEFLMDIWYRQYHTGLDARIEWNLEDLEEILLDTDLVLPQNIESVLFYDIISSAISYYNIWCRVDLDIYNKRVIFVFRKSGVHRSSLRLSDFDVNTIEKSFGDYNLVTILNSNYTVFQKWVLTKNNNVRLLENTSESEKPYPLKNRNYVAEEEDNIYDIVYDAVINLAQNRYQENIDLNAQQYKSIVDLTSVDFSWDVDVYTEEGFYKTLPVGEIETDSSGKHIVRLGYRIQELTQEL